MALSSRFENLQRHNVDERAPGRETIEKNGPSTLGAWLDSNFDAKGAGPKDEAEWRERVAGSRRLGLVMGLLLVGIVWLAAGLSS